MMEIEKLLDKEIQHEFSTLKDKEVGTEEHKTSVDELTKLLDRAIEMKKINIEVQDKIENREFENDLKLKQMKTNLIDLIAKHGISAVGLLLTLGVGVWGTILTFKFEEEGTVTSSMGRGFINNINKLLFKK